MSTKPKMKRPKPTSRLSSDQTRDDNKASFVERLMEAAWKRKEAEQEYDEQTSEP